MRKLINEAQVSGFLSEVEFCVADNSEDALTENVVMAMRTESNAKIKYVRHGENLGYDRNVDAAIKLADGDYCWFLSDNEDVRGGSFFEIFKEVKNTPEGAVLIICPETMPPEKLKTYSGFEAAVSENDWWMPGGLVSRNIVKRDLIPSDLSGFFGNYWLHLSITTMVAGDRPIRFISEKFVDDPQGAVRWAKNGTTFLTYTSLLNLIEDLPVPPYSQEFKRRLARRMRRGLPRNILSSKLYGLSATMDNWKRLYRTIRFDLISMVLSSLAMSVPPVLVKYAKNIKQNIGH